MPTDPEHNLLLVTCASGKQASCLLPLLAGRWKRLRLVVHSAASRARLAAQHPGASVVQADVYDGRDVAALLDGVAVVLHIGPSYHPHETEIGYLMVDAAVREARRGAFKHFVLSSVLNSQLRKMMNHDCKRYVEEYVMESGLPYTILQPTTFMDNLPLPLLWQQARDGEDPVFRAMWSMDVPFSFVALYDVAEAMRTVLEEREKHFYAQYPLVSTAAPLTFEQAMRIVGERLGREVKIERLGFEDAVRATLLRLKGTEEVDLRTRDAAQRMLLFYNYRGLIGNPNVLNWLIGRKPLSYADWVDMRVKEEESKES